MALVTMAALSAGAALGVLLMVQGLRGNAILPTREKVFGGDIRADTALAWAAGALISALVVLAMTGWPVAAAAVLFLVVAAPRSLGGGGARKHAVAKTQAIASWTEMIRDNMAGAAGLEQALMATAEVAPTPIKAEIRKFSLRLEDATLSDALAALGDDLNHPSSDLVVASLANAARMESRDLGPLLTRLADSIRGDVRMRLRVEVGRTRIRTSARIVVGVTVFTMLFMFIFSRDLLDAYDSTAGQLWLLLVFGVFALGGWLINIYGQIDMPERFSARRGHNGSTRERTLR